jgi:hypothetical protein
MFTSHSRILSLASTLFACCAHAELPSSIRSAPDDAWVPVMVLADQDGTIKSAQPVLLGLAQVKDIEDGYPYKVGIYQLNANSSFGALSTQISAGTMMLTPVCSGASAPRCEPLVGIVGASVASGTSINARYQLGPVQLNAGLFNADRSYTQLLNPYLPFPSTPTLTLLNGAERQNGFNLTGSVDSKFGQFGVGVGVARTPLGPLQGNNGRLDESNLSFNWLHGAFSTKLSTRVMDVSGARTWGGLDLGLTWRTPWQGTLSFGAKNLVVSGKPPAFLDPDRAADAVEQERVPYVRYEQDL